jgi:hypothetical protein
VIILFGYKDTDNIPREVQRHCSTVPEVGDSVWVTTPEDATQEYKVSKKDWYFYSPTFNTAHPIPIDTDITVTVTLTKAKNSWIGL